MADRKQKFSVDAVGSDEYLTALTRRVEILEKKLVGSRGIKEDQPPLKPTLEMLNDKLITVFGKLGQGTVATLWSKITALEKALNPDYVSNLKLTDSAKSELLIGYASQLKDLSKPIEELQQLKDYLNLTEFQGLEGHEKKLASIANVHAKQELQMEDISRQIHELMSGYSRVMLQLSAQLVECGETVTRMESKK